MKKMVQKFIEKHELKKYVTEPSNEWNNDKTNNTNLKLNEILINSLGIEKEVIKITEQEKVSKTYPILDPSFLNIKGEQLEICNKKKYKVKVTLPKFAVYNLDNPHFEITGKITLDTFWVNYYVNYYGENSVREIKEKTNKKISTKLPKILETQLLKSIEYSTKIKKIIHGRKDYHVAKYKLDEHFSKYKWSATTTFSLGLIPDEIKDKIKETKNIFQNDLYVITEATNWTTEATEEIDPDPLLIGIKNKKCYLIAAFNCTPLEEYVRREFTE